MRDVDVDAVRCAIAHDDRRRAPWSEDTRNAGERKTEIA
jgi:hypothetical protein